VIVSVVSRSDGLGFLVLDGAVRRVVPSVENGGLGWGRNQARRLENGFVQAWKKDAVMVLDVLASTWWAWLVRLS
jgi:hypothetical protein